MKILNEFENILLKRRELEFVVRESSNPGFEKMREMVAKEFNSETGNVVVKNVKNNFGDNNFVVSAFIYDSAEGLKMTEPEKKEKKEGS